MKIENPIAFRFILQDDVYLLNNDRPLYTGTAPQPTVETQPVNFNSLGVIKKKFLVMVHYTEPEFIAENHLTALQNILKRLEFSMDDVAILNRANHSGASFQDVMDFFDPLKLLLLGELALPAGIETLTLNKSTKLNNCNTLFSFSFDEMMDSTENKKAFWEQVKQL